MSDCQPVDFSRGGDFVGKIGRWLCGVLAALVFLCLDTTASLADDPSLAPPPVHQVVDSNGVDLTTGTNMVAGPSISVGQPGQSGLTYSLSWQGRGWQSNLVSSVSYSNASNDRYTVQLMGQSYTFQQSGTVFNSTDGMGETLVFSGSNYIFTARDGTVAVFDASHTFSYAVMTTVGLLSSVTYPTGEVLTFTQQVVSPYFYVVLSVNSTLGYQIKLFYDSSYNTTQVVAINNAVDYCAPTATSCSFSQSWPTLNFSYSSSTGAVSVIDANGNTTTGIFRSVGTALENRVTYPSGRYLSFLDTDLDNYIDTVTDGTSTWQYTYDLGSGVTTHVTDPLGHVRVVATDSAIGVLTSDTLDPSGLNLQTLYSHDSFGRITQITYPAGNASVYSYDARGNILQITQVSSTPGSPASIDISASFPTTCSNPLSCNKPDTVTDANGNTTSYTYNSANGAFALVTSPPVAGGNAETRYTYSSLYAWYKNASGSIVAAPTPVYMLTQTSQCMSGVETPPTGPLWGSATWGMFTWTAATSSCIGTSQEVVATTGYPSGSASLATNLLPSSQSRGAGDGSLTATTSLTYDAIGNVASIDGPLPGSSDTTVFFYDGNRNQIGIVRPDPDGSGPLANPATKMSYNGDNLLLEADQGTAPSQSYYDFNNNFTSLTQGVNGYSLVTGAKTGSASALGGVVQSITQYSFDGARNPLCTAVRQTASSFGPLSAPFSSLPDACSQSTASNTDIISHNDYDAANRLAGTDAGYGTSLQQAAVTNHYTINSKIDWVEDANGNRSAYTYDGLDRLVQLNFPNPSTLHSPSSTDFEQYGYDNNGNLTSKTLRGGGSISYSFDALNRPTLKHLSSGTSTDVYTSYDLVGNVLYAHYGSSGGSGVDFAWDALGRKLSEASYGRTVSSQYDLAGNRTRLTYPDTNYIQYTYDVLNRMQQVEQNGSTSMVQYAYDNLGRVSSIGRNNSATTNYSYDSADQGWSVAQTGLNQNVTFGMNYTAAGQVNQRSISNSAYAYNGTTLTQGYSSNGLNQYTAVGVGPGYSYDLRGNLTSDGARNFSYDLNNWMTAVSGPASMTLGYDPLGRLQQTASSTTEQYLYDSDNLIVEYDASGNILRRYVPGASTDQPLIWYEGSGFASPNWLHTDQQGNIIAASNTSAVATPFAYGPYGEPSGGWSGTSATPIFRYTGQVILPAVKLYYYKARMYEPTLGRFMQTDPVGYTAGLNLYAYASNDPVNETDPTGEDGAEACPRVSDPTLGGIEQTCVTAQRNPPSTINPGPPNFGTAGTPDLSQGAGAKPPSTNKDPSRYLDVCIKAAVLEGAINTSIDSLGLIAPGGRGLGKGVARFIGNQAGYRGIVADQFGARVSDAFGKSVGAKNLAYGITDTSPEGELSTLLGVAGFVPILSQYAAGASIALDLYKTGQAIARCEAEFGSN